MYNKVVLVGNLARDPEMRYLPTGSAVCNTAIATNRKFKKQDGTTGEEVCFIDIAFFNRTAEVANQYLKRGSKILVEGRLKLDQWTDQSGGKRSKHSVVVETMQMLDTKSSGFDNQNSSYSQPQQTSYSQPMPSYTQETYQEPAPMRQTQVAPQKIEEIPSIDIDEDEIPF